MTNAIAPDLGLDRNGGAKVKSYSAFTGREITPGIVS
jgi:hypothetical protein